MSVLVSHQSTNCNFYAGTSSNVSKVVQSFTTPAGSAADLESVTIPLGKGTATGTITLALYAVDGSGFPTGGVLSSGTVAGSALVAYASGTVTRATYDQTISMSAFSLQASTTYALQISSSVATDQARWLLLTTYNYSGGHPSRYRNASFPPEGWEDISASFSDLQFSVAIPDALPGKPINPTPVHEATGVSLSLATLTWESGS